MLRLATLDGARALGLGDRIGSLRPGKEADIMLLRADAVNLVAAHDPIGAVVTAAHPGMWTPCWSPAGSSNGTASSCTRE